jgi:3-methylcrotonyl-CoA carboxylase alpha subunit
VSARNGADGAAAARSPWEVSDAFQPNLPALIELTLSALGRTQRVRLTLESGEPCEALVLAPAEESVEKSARPAGGARLRLAGVAVTDGTVSAVLEGQRRGARWFRRGPRLHVWLGDTHHEFAIEDPRTREFTASASTGGLTTPLPGVVSTVTVREGQAVAAGEVLMVLEAMKMEHSITAPYEGVVSAIHFARGDRVPEGSELLTLSRAGDA